MAYFCRMTFVKDNNDTKDLPLNEISLFYYLKFTTTIITLIS